MGNEESQELSEDQLIDQFLTSNTESDDQPIDEVAEEESEEETEAEETETETEDGETEAEEETEEETEEPAYLTEGLVEIDGEAVEIQELKQGHLRQADYTRKTQEVAEQRKQAEQQRQEYESQLNALSVAAGTNLDRYAHMTEQDWQQMALQKPEDYKRHRAEFDQALRYQQFISNQVSENNAKVEQAREAERKARATETVQTLRATIPGWSNDLYLEIGKYAETQGISNEEFNEVVDPRLITVLHKAQQFDSAKQVTKKKIASSPKKTLSGGQAAPKLSAQKRKKARAKLKQTGSREAAIEAFMTN